MSLLHHCTKHGCKCADDTANDGYPIQGTLLHTNSYIPRNTQVSYGAPYSVSSQQENTTK